MLSRAMWPEWLGGLRRGPILAALLACALICQGCGDGEKREGKDASHKAQSSGQQSGEKQDARPSAANSSQPQAPSPEDLAQANAMLEFSNMALEKLHRGAYALPEELDAGRAIYERSFRLPRLRAPRGRKRDRAALLPPPGLFSQQEEADLASALDGMDAALDAMLARYADLERYVADDGIVDDGKKGRELSAAIRKAHQQFMAARKSWLATSSARSREAEQLLLQGHPLRRQILGAQDIFQLFDKVKDALSAEKPDKIALAALGQDLALRCEQAGEPPFPAPPAQERAFRHFLQKAQAYKTELARGLAQGFYTPVRRRLNILARQARGAYNAFAKSANEMAGH